MKINEDSLREFWDNIKCTNICIKRVPEREEKEKGPEKIFEGIIARNFPNMKKETLTQVKEAQIIPYRMNPRRNMLRHILVKLTKFNTKKIY